VASHGHDDRIVDTGLPHVRHEAVAQVVYHETADAGPSARVLEGGADALDGPPVGVGEDELMGKTSHSVRRRQDRQPLVR